MATITIYPLHDPVTGESLDNLETMPCDVIEHLRERGHSDDEIRTLHIELHDAIEDFKQIMALLTLPRGQEH